MSDKQKSEESIPNETVESLKLQLKLLTDKLNVLNIAKEEAASEASTLLASARIAYDKGEYQACIDDLLNVIPKEFLLRDDKEFMYKVYLLLADAKINKETPSYWTAMSMYAKADAYKPTEEAKNGMEKAKKFAEASKSRQLWASKRKRVDVPKTAEALPYISTALVLSPEAAESCLHIFPIIHFVPHTY